MTSPRRLKPVTLLACAGGLVAVILWVTPGAAGLWGNATGGAKAAAAGGAAVEGDPPDKAATRVRERPAEPDKAQRHLRSLLAERRGVRQGQRYDIAKMRDFQDRLRLMETDELLAILNELDASDASLSEKRGLAGDIANKLGNRDPALAMDTFVGRISLYPQPLLMQLGIIYREWMHSDPAAAVDWFDRQAESGKLAVVADTGSLKVDPRMVFESQLVRSQAALDPAAAEARFQTMPEETREKMLLDDWFSGYPAEEQKSAADFIRTHYEDSTSALVKAGKGPLGEDVLGNARNFMDTIEATPEERSALVGEALRLRIQDRDEMALTPEKAREWIVKQAPAEDAERLTGTMLGQMTAWLEFPGMSALALKYRQESGSDEVLVAFLKSAPETSREDILKLAAEVTDPAERAEITGRFAE